MMENDRLKTVLQYAAGILVLALCTASALYLPGWYADRQDEEMTGSVTLSERDTIELINVTSLEIEETLRMLGSMDSYYFEDTEYLPVNIPEEEIVNTYARLVQEWCDAGLLPETYGELAANWEQCLQTASIEMLMGTGEDYVDRYVMSCVIFSSVSMESGNGLTVVMDLEKEMIYYASASGLDAYEAMSQELGYRSAEEMEASVGTWRERRADLEEPDSFDFASVCGAEQASVERDGNNLELTASLTFDSSEGNAYRKVIFGSQGFGTAVMFGTDKWGDLIDALLSRYGEFEYTISTQELLEGARSVTETEIADDAEKSAAIAG